MTVLRGMFLAHLILKFGDTVEPRITAPEICLSGYLKTKVYENHPHSPEELKSQFTEKIKGISGCVLAGVM